MRRVEATNSLPLLVYGLSTPELLPPLLAPFCVDSSARILAICTTFQVNTYGSWLRCKALIQNLPDLATRSVVDTPTVRWHSR